MDPDLNILVDAGRFSGDPVLSQTANGVPVGSVELAIERRQDRRRRPRPPTPIAVAAFGRAADMLCAFGRGDFVVVHGHLALDEVGVGHAFADAGRPGRYKLRAVAYGPDSGTATSPAVRLVVRGRR